MTLLIDSMPLTYKFEESNNGAGGKLIVRGQFARSDRATENKRLYRESLWKREIGRLSESMSRRGAFGELDHPADGRTKLQRVSHIMTALRVEGNEVIGEAEILDTPNGRILAALYKAGAQVGVSSRGHGSTKTLSDGTEEVQEDFRLDTFDFVADPATKTAYPKPFAEECERIKDAEKDLTVESLRKDFGGLLRLFAEEERANTGRSIMEAEERAKTRLRSEFAGQLRRLGETVAEDAFKRAKSDLESDPEVAGARTVVEQIAALVQPFGLDAKTREVIETKDKEIEALRAQLADRELETQAASKSATEAKALATEAVLKLHVERALRENPSRDTISKLLGSLSQYKSVAEIDERINVLKVEFADRKPKAQQEAADEVSSLKARIATLETELGEATSRITASHETRDEAVRKQVVAENENRDLKVKVYAFEAISGHPHAKKLRALTEDAVTTAEVDRIVSKFVPDQISESEAERIRARVGRGSQTGSMKETGLSDKKPKNPQESVGLLEEVGVSDKEYDRLMG